MTEHPPIDTLARFAQGLLPPRELAAVAIHVARCEVCRTAATRPSLHPETGSATHGEAIHRNARWARNSAIRPGRNRQRAPGTLDQILALPAEDWNRAIRSSPRYQSYAFAQHALKTCRAGWSDNPHRSERLAHLALEVANRLPNKEHGRRNLNDLRFRAWSYIGNCRRIRADYFTVPTALAAAAEYLGHGTRNPRHRADLLSFTTSFLVNTGRFDETISICAEVELLSRELKAPVVQGKNLILLSRLYDLERLPEKALAMTREAGQIIDATGRPTRLAMIQRTNLAIHQAEAGNPEEALAVLRSIEAAQVRALPKLNQLRLAWTIAAIRWKLGDLEKALTLLTGCRDGFDDAQRPCDTALVDLELARLCGDLDRTEEAVQLSNVALQTFARLGIERDTLKALEVFQQAGGLEPGTHAARSTGRD